MARRQRERSRLYTKRPSSDHSLQSTSDNTISRLFGAESSSNCHRFHFDFGNSGSKESINTRGSFWAFSRSNFSSPARGFGASGDVYSQRYNFGHATNKKVVMPISNLRLKDKFELGNDIIDESASNEPLKRNDVPFIDFLGVGVEN
jgi:hypothetical protein